MAYLNKVFLIGNLTRDPEIRVTPTGTSVCQFGIAVNRTFAGENGAKREEVTFLDVEAWQKYAELVAKYLTKGSSCMIEGRLKLETWDDKTSGQKRSRIKVVLENVQFLGGKRDGEKQGGQYEQERHEPQSEPRFTPPPSRPQAPSNSAMDEDVPF